MFIQGIDDQLLANECVLDLAHRLHAHDHTGYEVHMYQGAGHPIEPPQYTHTRASYSGRMSKCSKN